MWPVFLIAEKRQILSKVRRQPDLDFFFKFDLVTHKVLFDMLIIFNILTCSLINRFLNSKSILRGGDTPPRFALKLHSLVNFDPTTTFCNKSLIVSKKFVIKNSLQSAFFDCFSLISPKIANALLQIHNAIPVCRA